jgi:tetratricopeptide (TPR) repeat protein
MVRYCSEDCQKRDWKKVHKNDCKLLKSVRQSVRKDPEDDSTLPSDKSDRVFARQQRGMRHLQKGNIAAGEKEFRANIELEGFHTIGAYYNLASSLTMQNRNSEALVYVQKAVNLPVFGPEDRSCLLAAYSLLGTLQSGAGGNSQAAKEAYQKALELDPGNEEIKMYLNRV